MKAAEKFILTLQEASDYFSIGEKKMRKLVNENPTARFVLWNGNRAQIKRTEFEKFIISTNAI